MADIVKHLEACCSFLEQIKGTAAVAGVLQKQRGFVEHEIASAVFSVEVAERMCARIHDIPWDEATKQSLLELVAAHTQHGLNTVPLQRTKCQDFTFVREYFTLQQWQMLTNSEANPQGHRWEMLGYQVQWRRRVGSCEES